MNGIAIEMNTGEATMDKIEGAKIEDMKIEDMKIEDMFLNDEDYLAELVQEGTLDTIIEKAHAWQKDEKDQDTWSSFGAYDAHRIVEENGDTQIDNLNLYPIVLQNGEITTDTTVCVYGSAAVEFPEQSAKIFACSEYDDNIHDAVVRDTDVEHVTELLLRNNTNKVVTRVVFNDYKALRRLYDLIGDRLGECHEATASGIELEFQNRISESYFGIE